jgi:DNA-binding protein HU-beta
MNKNDLVAYIAEETELTKTDAARALEAVIDGITTGLKQNGEVRLVGFGTFLVSQRAATTGRNPRTGEEISIKATKSAKFKAGKQLKDNVNDNSTMTKSAK